METKENKTHWRKCDKTDFLGAADLEEMLENGAKTLSVTIKHVEIKEAKVRGVKGQFRIATFVENIKPMIINVGNGKILRKFANSKYVEDWKNMPVSLFVQDNVKLGSETTDAVRISPTQPAAIKPDLSPEHPKWAAAKNAIKAGSTTILSIKKSYNITPENEQLLTAA